MLHPAKHEIKAEDAQDEFSPEERTELRKVFTDERIAALPSILTTPGEMEQLHYLLRGGSATNNLHVYLPESPFRQQHSLHDDELDAPQTPHGNTPVGHSDMWLRQTFRQFLEHLDATLVASRFDFATYRRLAALGAAVFDRMIALCEKKNSPVLPRTPPGKKRTTTCAISREA